jgi:hypothetical protein
MRDTGFAASTAGKASIMGYLQPTFNDRDFPDGLFGTKNSRHPRLFTFKEMGDLTFIPYF